jgi:hypothetical protein
MAQLSQALTGSTTILPNGRRGPYMRYSGAEKPRVLDDLPKSRRTAAEEED